MIFVQSGETPVSREGKLGAPQERQPFIRVYEAALPEQADHRGYETPGEAWRAEPTAREILSILFGDR